MIPSVTLNKTNICTDFNKFIRNASIKMNNINAYLKLNLENFLITIKFDFVVAKSLIISQNSKANMQIKFITVAFCV